MPHTTTWESKGVYRHFNGLVTGEEILESNFKLQADSRFEVIDYVINDFTRVTDHTVTLADTNAYAVTDEIAANEKPSLNIAIIVTKKDLFEVADMYCELMKAMKYNSKTFKTIKQARSWVALDTIKP